MVATAVRDVINSLKDAREHLGLIQSTDDHFFGEWQDHLPALSDEEHQQLDRVRDRLLRHWDEGKVDEGVVDLIVVSCLMELAGFYDHPFTLRSEVSVAIESEQQDEAVRGRIDFWVIHDRLWRAIMESKQSTYAIGVALPQTLAYMAAAPKTELPLFGFVTNGLSYSFLKLKRQAGVAQYAYSSEFSLLSTGNKLYDVLQILKRFAGIIAPNQTR